MGEGLGFRVQGSGLRVRRVAVGLSRRCLLSVVCVILLASSALAHGIHVDAHVHDRTIHGSAYYHADEPVVFAKVTAFDPSGKVLAKTTTDEEGRFSFEAKYRCDHRILVDAGYKGHKAPQSHKFRVFTAGQKRRVTPAIKWQMKRRAAVEPVIGHLKDGHRMGRNYLAHSQGDAINPILAAVGYNFRLILKWIRLLCLQIWIELSAYQSAKTA